MPLNSAKIRFPDDPGDVPGRNGCAATVFNPVGIQVEATGARRGFRLLIQRPAPSICTLSMHGGPSQTMGAFHHRAQATQ
jgi:hypothetical protein